MTATRQLELRINGKDWRELTPEQTEGTAWFLLGQLDEEAFVRCVKKAAIDQGLNLADFVEED